MTGFSLIPVKDLRTIKRLPPTIRGTVYEAMLQAVSEELAIWRASIEEVKTTFYDVDLVDVSRLEDIAEMFGVPFIANIRSGIDWMREEVRSIPFKIFYKGTTTLYYSFITAVDRLGEVYIYTYRVDLNGIARSMLPPFNEAAIVTQNKPFRHRSRGDFSGVVKSFISLDNGYYLDSTGAIWHLDTEFSEISTNHIGIEYWIDRLIERSIVDENGEAQEFLMTKEYLDFLNKSMEFGRRAKEVSHIGSQLNIQTDKSGLYNAFDPSMEYSVPDLKLKIAARADFSDHVHSVFDLTHAEFGLGMREIASVQKPDIPFPTDLAYRIAKVPVLFKEHYENDEFIGASGEYLGQTIQETKLLSGTEWFDGVNKNFSFFIPMSPIQKGNCKFEFRIPNEISPYVVEDDKKGGCLSIYAKGAIDYITGSGSLTTDFDYGTSEFITKEAGETDRTHFVQQLISETSDVILTPESLWLYFMIGDGVNQRMYLAHDDGNGRFIHPMIVNGTIDYETRIVDVSFIASLVDPDVKPFKCAYSYHINYALPEGTELWISYYFTQQVISITEAGFRSHDGTLVIYATFPPMEFVSNRYHCNFLVLVKKLVQEKALFKQVSDESKYNELGESTP
jgi:hypothetical protein